MKHDETTTVENETVETEPMEEPTPPFPKQHLEKPGIESDLDPLPKYEAPRYREAGKLDALQDRLLFAEKRPDEELYDLSVDPHEVNNLAADPHYATTLQAMRAQLARWEASTVDKGREAEPTVMYESDMKVYLGSNDGRPNSNNEELQRNIELNKEWAQDHRPQPIDLNR